MLSTHLNRNHLRAFTLIELLVVIGLIAVLAGGIGMALGGGDKANALQGAQGTLQSMVSATRGQAALAGANAALFVDVTNSNLDPQKYLRTFVVAVRKNGRWEVAGDEVALPSGIYVVPESGVQANGYKTSKGLTTSGQSLYYSDGSPYPSGASTGSYALVLELNPRGTKEAAGVESQIILSPAEVVPSGAALTIEFKQPLQVRGAIVSNYGVITPINDESGFE